MPFWVMQENTVNNKLDEQIGEKRVQWKCKLRALKGAICKTKWEEYLLKHKKKLTCEETTVFTLCQGRLCCVLQSYWLKLAR